MDEEKTDLELAMELDEVEGLATSEAAFLGKALKALKTKQDLKELDSKRLHKIWEKHLAKKDEGAEGDGEKNPDEQDLDEDDFV